MSPGIPRVGIGLRKIKFSRELSRKMLPWLPRLIKLSSFPLREIVKAKVEVAVEKKFSEIARGYLEHDYTDFIPQQVFGNPDPSCPYREIKSRICKHIFLELMEGLEKADAYGAKVDLRGFTLEQLWEIAGNLGIKKQKMTIGSLRKKIKDNLLNERFLSDHIEGLADIMVVELLEKYLPQIEEVDLAVGRLDYMGHATLGYNLPRALLLKRLYSEAAVAKNGISGVESGSGEASFGKRSVQRILLESEWEEDDAIEAEVKSILEEAVGVEPLFPKSVAEQIAMEEDSRFRFVDKEDRVPRDYVFSKWGILDGYYGNAGILIPIADWAAAEPEAFDLKGKKNEWDEEYTAKGPVDLENAFFIAPYESREWIREKLADMLETKGSDPKVGSRFERILFYNSELFQRSELPIKLVEEVEGLYAGGTWEREVLMGIIYYFFHTRAGRREMSDFLQKLSNLSHID